MITQLHAWLGSLALRVGLAFFKWLAEAIVTDQPAPMPERRVYLVRCAGCRRRAKEARTLLESFVLATESGFRPMGRSWYCSDCWDAGARKMVAGLKTIDEE